MTQDIGRVHRVGAPRRMSQLEKVARADIRGRQEVLRGDRYKDRTLGQAIRCREMCRYILHL